MPRPALSRAEIASFREELCAVAERRFAEHGYGGVTLRALAAELRVSPMTPYRYFRDKDDIFAAVRTAGFRRFADAQERAATAPDPEERLRALARAYFDFARSAPHAYRIMFEMNPLGRGEEYPELHAEQLRAWTPLRDAVAHAVRAGVLRGDAERLAHVFWAGLHGIVSLDLAGTYAVLGEDAEALLGVMERSLFEGNRAPGRARR